MNSEINIRELSAMIRAKRGRRGLRAIADEIGGVSASTLSRIEQENLPDLDTFIRVCRWLGVKPEHFTIGMNTASSSESDSSRPVTPQIVAAHLRADRTLNPKTAEALITMIQLAYDAIERGEIVEDEES